MKKIPLSLLWGLISIIVTVILYFVILGNIFLELMCFVTLLGVVIAEAVTALIAYYSKIKPARVAAAGVAALMVPISIILSVVYIVNFPEGYATYVALYVAFYLVIGYFSYILFSHSTKNINFQNAKDNVLNMRKIVKCILADPAAEKYEKELETLEEKLHFSVDNVIVADDAKISEMLLKLKDNIASPDFDVEAAITELNKAIDTRNIMASRTV